MFAEIDYGYMMNESNNLFHNSPPKMTDNNDSFYNNILSSNSTLNPYQMENIPSLHETQHVHQEQNLDNFQLDKTQFEENQRIIQSNNFLNKQIPEPPKEKKNPTKTSVTKTVPTTTKTPVTTKASATKNTPTSKRKRTTKNPKTPKTTPKKNKTKSNTSTSNNSLSVENLNQPLNVPDLFNDWTVSGNEQFVHLRNLVFKNEQILSSLINGLKGIDTSREKQLMIEFYKNYSEINLKLDQYKLGESVPELPINPNTYFISDLI